MNTSIETVRKTNKDCFLPSTGETCFRTIDGSDVAEWLEGQGHSLAVTTCGITVSTNGHVGFTA